MGIPAVFLGLALAVAVGAIVGGLVRRINFIGEQELDRPIRAGITVFLFVYLPGVIFIELSRYIPNNIDFFFLGYKAHAVLAGALGLAVLAFSAVRGGSRKT
ncbi:MAG: hypothetical protein N2B03_04345 [Boseongicola sp.]